MAKNTTIIVATRQLVGGTEKGGTVTLAAEDELTAAKAKALGLDEDAIAALIARGDLREMSARMAEGSAGDGELAAAIKRAETAEAKVAELEKQVAELKASAGKTGA